MKIDAFCGILPPKFFKEIDKYLGRCKTMDLLVGKMSKLPWVYDLDRRFQLMDRHPDILQVLNFACACSSTLEEITASPAEELDLARRLNEEMAELVEKYPERFVAAMATLPLSNVDVALKELDRAINDLRLRGVAMGIPMNGKPLDVPELIPLYERMCEFNLPIALQPGQGPWLRPDYVGETESKYDIWIHWGWPYETAATMTRLIFSGIMERFPNLKIITHHAGGSVPFFKGRLEHGGGIAEMSYHQTHNRGLPRLPIEYYQMFYADTCVDGNTSALMCAYEFFGADKMLFGTDIPLPGLTQITVESVENMSIPDVEKKKIFGENARKLMRLHIV